MKRILFVDDEERVLDGLRRLARGKRDEWECQFATSVDDALVLIDQGLDAIVSDLNMPGKDGIDLLKILRSQVHTANLPCLILTGNGELQAKKSALEHGATDFLSKPVDFWELSARLENCISLKQYQDLVLEQRDSLDARVKQATLDLDNSRKNIILRLALAAEWRDENTGMHILRVAMLSAMLARGLGMSDEDCERILLSSPLHDVGKISLTDQILHKPGLLEPEEREIMKNHCQVGYEILAGENGAVFEFMGPRATTDKGNGLLETAALIALTHHERWDGTGYPKGLKGEEIPIEGRIVAVADVYDALRARRPYKEPFSRETTLGIMRDGSGSHFDPDLVRLIEAMSDEAEAILAQFGDGEANLALAA